MKNTRLTALLLALCLTLALFAGCAKTEPAAQTAEETPANAAAEEAPAAQETETTAQAEETPAQEAPATDQAAIFTESGLPTGSRLSYPIADGTAVITVWADFETQAWLSTNNDLPILPELLEATGVDIEFTEVSKAQTTEQFQLMIAGGDYKDLLNVDGYYSGGSAQAYEDEVIINLLGIVEDNAPDWWAMYQTFQAEADQGLLTTSSNGDKLLLSFTPILSANYGSGGLLVREDWLETVGYTAQDMTTLEGFTNALKALADAGYAAEDVYHMEGGGVVTNFNGFDTTYTDMTAALASLYLFVGDDGLESGFVADGYREYIAWFKDMIASGVFSSSFYTTHLAMNELLSQVGTGATACFQGVTDLVSMVGDYTDAANADMNLVAVGTVDPDDTHVNNWGEADIRMKGDTGKNISSTCENPELACQYLNFFFTQQGALMANYGSQGVSYELDEAGEPVYTDAVLNNPDITSASSASSYYGAQFGPYYNIADKLFSTYDDATLDCITTWTKHCTSTSRTYPSTCKLTTDETSAITNAMNDVVAYGQEAILKFIAGATALTDENWNAYVEACYNFGLQDCLDVYQAAYDEYLAGER